MSHYEGWAIVFHGELGMWKASKAGILRSIHALTRERLERKIDEFNTTGCIMAEEA